LIAFYLVLAAVVAGVTVVVIHKGGRERSQPYIAGGYNVSRANACIGAAAPPVGGRPLPSTAPALPVASGPAFNIVQSGQFVDISNIAGTLSGQLRLHPGALAGAGHRLTGTVDCVKGPNLRIDAVATAGPKGKIAGTLGGLAFAALFKRDPPAPGSPNPRIPHSIKGPYALSPRSTCFGSAFALAGGGSRYRLSVSGQGLGALSFSTKTGALSGDVRCVDGGPVRLTATSNDRVLNTVLVIPLDVAHPPPLPSGAKRPAKQVLSTASGLPPYGEQFTATKTRDEASDLVAAFFLAVAVVMIVARLFGVLAAKIGQPRVMGEVIAGIVLGPSVLGAISQNAQADIFPSDILPALNVAANLGLIFYMFLIGLEFDRSALKGRLSKAAAISNASVALPMILGMVAALPLYKLIGPDKKFAAFALFMGVAMSITAFPVLARILAERRMLRNPVGSLAIGCAALDDVTAWFLIALATAVSVSGSFGQVAKTVGEAVAFVLVMALIVRPVLARVSTSFDEVGRISGGWLAAIFAGVLLSAYITESINIAVIFGGFVMGMVMPRNTRLTEEVTRRVEDYVVILLLPLFFAYTGLQTDIGLLNRPELWLITVGLIAIAVVGKFGGAAIAARVGGFDWRASAVFGILMNTRGLTELIALNIALSAGAISNALYAALVLMALVTTLMAGPLLKLIDRENRYGAQVEDEFAEARRVLVRENPDLVIPDRSILVAPQTNEALPQLLTLAEPLARSFPRRELVLARLVEPPRRADVRGGLQTENALLKAASSAVMRERRRLLGERLAARGVALTSSSPGTDIAHLVDHEKVDLVLVEGRRPLLGQAVPLGEVSELLESAASDVAVLVARESDPIRLTEQAPVLVVFGGAEHDWSALELGSWLAAANNVPLKLLGAAGSTEEGGSVTRMLADAGLLAQQFSGVTTEPLVIQGGREGILAAAAGAGILVIGLSERWRREGLGATRADIARAAPAPVLFVRRGARQGALAPRDSLTRFQWSLAGPGEQPEGEVPVG
jgi:Kef-type K+ transport system membrane component KefB